MSDPIENRSIKPSYNYKYATGYGALAGAIAAWAVSGVLLLVEIAFGFKEGLFYSVIGFAIAGPSTTTLNFSDAQYIGLGLHILTGTLVGALGGFTMAICPLFRIKSMTKSLVMGTVIGLTAWVVIFLPI